MYYSWDKDLDLEIEHVVHGHRFANLKEIFLASTIVVINEETARVPIVLSVVKHFELEEGCLACLYARVILVPRYILLLRHVLNVSEVLDRCSPLLSEHARDPSAPVVFLGNLCKFDIVLEANCILLPLTLDFSQSFRVVTHA